MARRPCRFDHVLQAILILSACTAPPPAPTSEPAPSAPPVQVRVEVVTPGGGASELDAEVAQPIEAALARLPAVRRLHTRSDTGRVEVVATLTHAGAIEAVRDAVTGVLPSLPPAAEAPALTRLDGVVPALALVTRPEHAGAVQSALERTAGVGRVELCGVGEPRTAVLLDRTRLAGVPLDALVAAVTAALADDDPAALERLASRPIAGALQLRDVAALQDGPRPPACRAYGARGPVALVLAATQPGADPSDVAARARPHAVDLVSPTADLFADPVPAGGAELAVLTAELRPRDDLGSALAGCLAAVPDLPAWALTVAAPDPAGPLARVRLLAGVTTTFPIEHVRRALSKCAGDSRVAVVAPRLAADHAVSLAVQGADPGLRADVAHRLGERIAGLPGLTGLRVRAPGPASQTVELRRDVLAARGVPLTAAVAVVRLALGPVTLHPPFVGRGSRLPVDIDLVDRTGPIDPLVRELYVGAPTGPVPLADLVQMQASAGGPLERIDRQPTASVEVRLRRAADGDAVRRAVKHFELPPGVAVVEGGELAEFGP
ncbi:efflux RND transporter permease subunit [Nannocystis bainbridge]|uniref:Efflux RND transporter permease subunit n=1 Tax=Nannocystis bainbridge TaxID=2995303 RepID=A0ABT5E673_9BACT|nr:efflux RND transporter permease subunit [Nannocystis bainbridge]MDC0721356.1 efflux RND transporter permease subunit [Nannocystis bainbridge]